MKKPCILITGGSRGLGEELVKIFSSNNWLVITTSRDCEKVNDLNKVENVVSEELDLMKPQSISNFADYIHNSGFIIDVLINNAGIATLGSLEFVNDFEREAIYKTNLIGPIEFTLKLLPYFNPKGGKIINISSDEGLIVLPQSVDYAISKHGFSAFSEGLHEELKAKNISVITIFPGNIETGLPNSIINQIKQREGDNSRNDLDRFLEEKSKLIEDIMNTKPENYPHNISRKIYDLVVSNTKFSSYLMTSPSETEYLVTTLIDQLVLLNQSSEYSFSIDELIDKLKFSYDVVKNM